MGYCTVSEKGLITEANLTLATLLGVACSSLVTKPFSRYIQREDEDEFYLLRRRLLAASTVAAIPSAPFTITPTACELRLVKNDGTDCWTRLMATVAADEQGETSLRIAVTDITERRHLEQQLRESQKLDAIGQLAGGIAHDFNNILMIIQGYGTLLLETSNPPDTAEAAQQIVKAAERAAGLTRQLLTFSRRQLMQSRVLDLNEIVTGLSKMLGRVLGENLRLEVSLDSRALLTRADAGMLEQVLLNLVVNARDAMPDGGRLEVATGEATLTAAEAGLFPDLAPGRHVWLRVTDTGSGIPPEHRARIFDPFFTTKGVGKGTGLGLATVFGIVKQHHGAITVVSEVGRGTTFQVFLPTKEAAILAPVAAAAILPVRGSGETILVVEDEASLRQLNRRVLERAGYRVLEAADGVEGQRLGEEHSGVIQLLFTDIMMPGGVSGHMLAARLRAKNPRLPVIFTSGYDVSTAGLDLSLEAGQDFLQKPVPLPQLLETVRRSLDRQASEPLA